MVYKTELDEITEQLSKMSDYSTKEAKELLEKWEQLTYKKELAQEKCSVMGGD
jgi:hypothetical protein